MRTEISVVVVKTIHRVMPQDGPGQCPVVKMEPKRRVPPRQHAPGLRLFCQISPPALPGHGFGIERAAFFRITGRVIGETVNCDLSGAPNYGGCRLVLRAATLRTEQGRQAEGQQHNRGSRGSVFHRNLRRGLFPRHRLSNTVE